MVVCCIIDECSVTTTPVALIQRMQMTVTFKFTVSLNSIVANSCIECLNQENAILALRPTFALECYNVTVQEYGNIHSLLLNDVL
jgi:hypothetical protein